MLPDRCAVQRDGKRCSSPPEFAMSVSAPDGQYLIGVTCGAHKTHVQARLHRMQDEGKIPKGSIFFEGIKAVGTDCIRGDYDDLIQL